MGAVMLNTIGLDGGVIIKGGGASSGGGGSKPSSPKWTGHADADGLRAIGWTDEDIAYYQEHGVNWNAEDDEYHKVSDDNKALYGVLTADNISTYKDRIVYLPKIDTSGKTSMYNMFSGCKSLVSIPQLDTSKATTTFQMFYNCYSLVSIPPLDTANVAGMSSMFYNCYSLVSIPQLDTASVTSMDRMFYLCYSLVSIPQLDTSKVTTMGNMFYSCYSLESIPQLDTASVTSMEGIFYNCYSLVSIPQLDTRKVAYTYNMFTNNIKLYSVEYDGSSMTNTDHSLQGCYNLLDLRVRGIKRAVAIPDSYRIRKESLLYLINNEAATSAITIKLASSAYTRLAEDADIVAALAAHPNISLAK